MRGVPTRCTSVPSAPEAMRTLGRRAVPLRGTPRYYNQIVFLPSLWLLLILGYCVQTSKAPRPSFAPAGRATSASSLGRPAAAGHYAFASADAPPPLLLCGQHQLGALPRLSPPLSSVPSPWPPPPGPSAPISLQSLQRRVPSPRVWERPPLSHNNLCVSSSSIIQY